ncbi:MAG: hypothetical protein LBD94_02895 [Rickettsiales bacterium]|jgi:hypothetical protein|nr:hypothetical protein [Rickettsiales bacterium]
MKDDERLFSTGVEFFIITLIAVAIFHVMFSSDEKKLNKKNREIAALEQDIANASVRFHELVQPETLRHIVMQIYPKYKPVGSGRVLSARNME